MSSTTADIDAPYRRYAELVLRWNQRINLTAARTLDEILDAHVADCRALLAHVPRDARQLLDVGSGAGFPGLVIAIARPDLHVVLLEPVQKKRAFLSTAARELGLSHVEARAERLEHHAGRGHYDVATSRATWPVPEWLERAAPFVRAGGVILGMEGRERHELPESAERHPYELETRTRSVVVFRR